jgi:hypothetical protein
MSEETDALEAERAMGIEPTRAKETWVLELRRFSSVMGV